MTKLVLSIVGMICLWAGVASAAPPAWCKGAQASSPDLRGLSSKDARDVVKTFVAAECAPTAEVEEHRGEIEAARQAWSKRLGMAEADWTDAVAYAAVQEYAIVPQVTAKTLAQASPIDQYAVVQKASDSLSDIDVMYAADMFEPNLTEAGRLAFVEATCLHNDSPVPVDAYGMTGTEVAWAICQPDLDHVDVTKLLGEVRGDTTHDGAIKMKLRIAAYELPGKIKAHAAEVQQMMARDDATKAVFKAAVDGRASWTAGVGKNVRLLEVVLAMDSAAVMQSRKQLEGCGETTTAALAAAASTIPAKAFAGMHDERDNPSAGFATRAGPVLAQSPEVVLASIAYLRCASDTDLAAFVKEITAAGPPSRGPRNAALAKIKSTKITYDKTDAKLVYPRPRPFGANYPSTTLQARSLGGAVKAVKRNGDMLAIDVEQTTVTTLDCVKSHRTNKIEKIHGDGRVQYEEICDKSATRTHDHTWTPFSISAKYAAWLKPGVVFSSNGKDVIAVWPNASAKTPSIVLGGAVK